MKPVHRFTDFRDSVGSFLSFSNGCKSGRKPILSLKLGNQTSTNSALWCSKAKLELKVNAAGTDRTALSGSRSTTGRRSVEVFVGGGSVQLTGPPRLFHQALIQLLLMLF